MKTTYERRAFAFDIRAIESKMKCYTERAVDKHPKIW